MAKRALEKISLQFVKQIRVQFCPWQNSAKETRSFFAVIATNKARETNPNCKFKTEIKHDGSSPQVLIEFDDGKKLLFKSERLMCREMIQKFRAIQQEKLELLSAKPTP